MTGSVTIGPLAETSGHIPTLVQWFETEWSPWYGPGGKGDARYDLESAARKSGLPYAMIALDSNETPLGTVTLRADSVGEELASGPWLTALLVDPARRGQGVGRALVAALESSAARFGHSQIFTSTDTAAGIMLERGWQRIGESLSLRGPVVVFRRVLDGAT